MKRTAILASAMCLVFACFSTMANAGDPNKLANPATHARLQQMLSNLKATARTATATNVCAIAVIPGPATGFDIRFGVFNIISPTIDFLIIDPFRALNGQSLLFQSVFSIVGGVTDLYPDGTDGKGPAVLGITGLGQFNSVSFNVDPDTYTDSSFGATVADMDKTRIEAVFSDGTRCLGEFHFSKAANASFANLIQAFP